jgi:CRP-like cAMP-binding protein
MNAVAERVRIFEHDPDLLAGVPADHAALLARVVTPALRLDAGAWSPAAQPADAGLGLLVVEGVITRRLRLDSRTVVELLGSGDLVKPWLAQGWEVPRCDVSWHVEEAAVLAFLGPAFTRQIGDHPQVFSALLEREILRSWRLASTMAIASVPGVEKRLLRMLWHLAERWGRVTRDGVVLEMPLTHRLLGELVGATRPTVTTALATLSRAGRVERRGDGSWLLCGGPPTAVLDSLWSVREPD